MKFFDTFAGCGGFRMGMTQTGHTPVGFCERDKHASKLYKAVYDTEGEYYAEDATKIITGELPDFDILCGGFPCQAFSVAGKRQGFGDTRGTLFFELARILKDKRPRYFIFENVKGLLSHDGGKTFQSIIQVLTDIGYTVEWQLLNTKFFGLPQNRERVFIVGHLGGGSGRKVFPIRQNDWPDSEKFSSTAIDSNYWKGVDNHGQRTLIYWKNSKEKWAQEERENVPTLKTQSEICRQTLLLQELTQSQTQSGRVYDIQGISPCLDTMQGGNKQPKILAVPLKYLDRNQKNLQGDYSFTVDTVNSGGVMKDKRIRRLTPLECFRLQGFPDYIVHKAREIGISDTQLYKMAGNAVSVPVIRELGLRIKEVEK